MREISFIVRKKCKFMRFGKNTQLINTLSESYENNAKPMREISFLMKIEENVCV